MQAQDQVAHQWRPAVSLPKERSVAICILLYIVTGGLYSLYWWYTTHAEHPRRQGVDDDPAMALIGMFIPIFNIYWFFRIHLRLSDRMNMLAAQAGRQGETVNKAFVWLYLIPFVGVIFYIMWWLQVMDAHNGLARSVRQAQVQA